MFCFVVLVVHDFEQELLIKRWTFLYIGLYGPSCPSVCPSVNKFLWTQLLLQFSMDDLETFKDCCYS